MTPDSTGRGGGGPAAELDFPMTIYLVKRLQLLLQGLVDNALREFAITPLQYTVLYILNSTPPQSSASLAREAFLTPQTMHQVVRALELRGLVVKRPKPANKRSLLVQLTGAGEALLAESASSMRAIEAALLDSFDPDQRGHFRRYLQVAIAATSTEAIHRDIKAARVSPTH